MAYLGLADRLAERYRGGRGTSQEDLLLLPEPIDDLPGPEQGTVVRRFLHDLDQYDIAARVGCSQMHVSRLLRRALGRLRSQLLVG